MQDSFPSFAILLPSVSLLPSVRVSPRGLRPRFYCDSKGAPERSAVRIVSVGEILWDVIGETEYLGGAPLNFAAHAQKLGHEVYPLSAVGNDVRGHKALELLRGLGMSTEHIQVLA